MNATSQDVFNALKPLLGLPDSVVSLDLRLRIDECPIITLTVNAQLPDCFSPEPVTQQFRLQDIDDD